MKKYILLLMCMMLFCACSYSTIKNSNKKETPQEDKYLNISQSKENAAEGVSSKKKYKKDINISIDKNLIFENLKSIILNPRKFGTEGENTSSNYLKSKLEEYGYIVSFQCFPVYKQDMKSTHVKYYSDYFKENPYNTEPLGTAKNIIAKSDIHNDTKKTIYLTAHYDTTANTSGVIDNGTGVAVVLEVARQLKDYDGSFNIEIVLFSAEEYFRTGSREFVSSLSEEEKENVIGCINVDMVGEKGAGDLVMKTPRAEHNILTLLLNQYQQKGLLVADGGSSDDLSFYLGKIPAITLANNNPDLSRHKDLNEIQYIDIEELQNTAYLITSFFAICEFSIFKKLLNDRSFTSNISANSVGFAAVAYKEKKNSVINGYRLIQINANLLENGYDCETEYVYENIDGKRNIITEKFITFLNLNIYGDFNALGCDYKNSSSFECLYSVNEDVNNNTKITYIMGNYFGEIKGDMSVDEAQNILKVIYREKYRSIFGE